jgi:hypothetical protein
LSFVVLVTGQTGENEDVMAIMMYDMSRQYHAERIMSADERRRADEQLGRMAARTSRLWRRATRPARALRGLRAAGATIGG